MSKLIKSFGWLPEHLLEIVNKWAKAQPRKVLIESPYAGDIETHVKYACRAMRDAFQRQEAPWCSHLIYTREGILDDTIPEERTQGIEAGLVWGSAADATIVYTDYGISRGMQYGIDRAIKEKRPIEYREIGKNKEISK